MNNERLGTVIRKIDDEAEGQSGFWRFTVAQRELLVITDENANRMRILTGVIGRFPADMNDFESTFCFLKGKENDQEVSYWTLGAHAADNVQVLQSGYPRRGLERLNEASRKIHRRSPAARFLKDIVDNGIDVTGMEFFMPGR